MNHPSKKIMYSVSYMNLELKGIAKLEYNIKFYYMTDIKTKLENFDYKVGQGKGMETRIDGNLE